MRLYFLRHSAALDGPDDALRPLSPEGRQQARKLARFLKRGGISFDLAFTSPLVRARETLDLVLPITNAAAPIKPQVTSALLNETSATQFANWLARLPQTAGHVLLVGHEPTLSERVRRLLGLLNEEALELRKGAIACVRTENLRSGSLKFLVTPKLLGAGRTPP
ncbi:MAG: phosphohistidine phosphatase SixA [Pedosphaera sp. Tous-C6FEB]|nr:MAG: phosphohistidine phosphatase SixA [Pedosphaera sp. Tous-C6FEB]